MKPSEFLNKNNPVSREEMQNYLEGKLSSADKKKVEEKFIDDDFASEATEGFTQTNMGFAALSSVNAAWEAKARQFGAKGVNYKYWFIGSSVIAVIAIVSAVFILNKNPKNISSGTPTAKASEKKDTQPETAETNPEVMTDEELKEEITEIKEAKQISASKQITYEKTIASQPETVIEKEPEVKELPVEAITVDGKEAEEIKVDDTKKVVESNVKMLYIKNLKAVDYSEFYTHHIAKKEWILTGITADKENAGSEGVVNEQVTKYIPYKDFLTETLTKFSKNDFKGTLSGLLTILQQYPDDINAAFYSGLCYYNLGKNKQAIAMFDKAIGNSITTFREESEWYKCLSLIEDGERNEAKELLKKISDENGFYGKAAKEKLKGMK